MGCARLWSFTVELSVVVGILWLFGCSGGSPSDDRSPAEIQASGIAIAAAVDEGILDGDPSSVTADRMTLTQAISELTEWGADFPEVADYPPADTPVWVVAIKGRGLPPGPPGADISEECLDLRVIVPEEAGVELALFGKPSDGC